MHGHRPLEIVAHDPETERFAVAIRTIVSVLISTFVAALGVSMVGLSAGPLAWLITAAGAVVGCLPLVGHAVRSRRSERLPLGRLPGISASKVIEAAAQARRLHELARGSPTGPVADNLRHLAETADGHVVALHRALTESDPTPARTEPGLGFGPPSIGRPIDDEADDVIEGLRRVVVAAEGLRRAQRRYLEHASLDELTERIQRLTEAIESEHLESGHSDSPELP